MHSPNPSAEFETERIAGRRYALWRRPADRESSIVHATPEVSLGAWMVVSGTALMLVLGAGFVAGVLGQSRNEAAGFSLSLAWLSSFVWLFVRDFINREHIAQEFRTRPEPLRPEGSVPAYVEPQIGFIYKGLRPDFIGKAHGFLKFDGSSLLFLGDEFDLRLQREDFVELPFFERCDFHDALWEDEYVALPGRRLSGRLIGQGDGLPSQDVAIDFFEPPDEEGRSTMVDVFRDWGSALYQPSTSIFPPIRYRRLPNTLPKQVFQIWFAVPLLVYAALCLLFPEAIGHLVSWPVIAVELYPLAGFVVYSMSVLSMQASNREVERLKRRHNSHP